MDFDDLLNQSAADVEAALESLLTEVRDDQVPIVKRASRRLVELQFQWLGEPDNRDQIKEDMRHPLSTLASEANLTQARAAKRVTETIRTIVMRAADVAVGLV